MTEKTITTTIEILGKQYPVRCAESEENSLQMAAKMVNQKMSEVLASGKAINLERIAIITALNLAHQLLSVDNQKSGVVQRINQRLSSLSQRLETALHDSLQTELLYSIE